MDLRRFNLAPAEVNAAKRLLAYQPFIISDDACTGVAYSWLHTERPEFAYLPMDKVHERSRMGNEHFALALETTARLIKTYEHFARTLCDLFPGASYLDVSCNTGWFPVVASQNGMGECAGLDPGDFGEAVAFLNRIAGGRAEFIRGGYLPVPPSLALRTATGAGPLGRQFDVVSNLEFLCHLADPLHFLHALASVARKAIFLWSGFIDSPELAIRFNPPLASAPPGFHDYFWGKFSNGTAMTTALLRQSMQMLGFTKMMEVGYPPDGLSPDWHAHNMAHYGPHRAFLFVRPDNAHAAP
jgi:hypothetical protein